MAVPVVSTEEAIAEFQMRLEHLERVAHAPVREPLLVGMLRRIVELEREVAELKKDRS